MIADAVNCAMRHLAASTRSSISTATAVKASCRARCRMTSMDGRGWGNVMTLPRDSHSRTCVMRTVCEAARARGVALSLPCGLGLVREDAPRPCSAADGHRRRRGPRLRLTRNNWHWLIPTLHADVQTTQRRSTACLAQQQWRARTCGLGAAPSAWAMGGGGGGGMCWETCCSRDTSVRAVTSRASGKAHRSANTPSDAASFALKLRLRQKRHRQQHKRAGRHVTVLKRPRAHLAYSGSHDAVCVSDGIRLDLRLRHSHFRLGSQAEDYGQRRA